jgi:hypothetical protein
MPVGVPSAPQVDRNRPSAHKFRKPTNRFASRSLLQPTVPASRLPLPAPVDVSSLRVGLTGRPRSTNDALAPRFDEPLRLTDAAPVNGCRSARLPLRVSADAGLLPDCPIVRPRSNDGALVSLSGEPTRFARAALADGCRPTLGAEHGPAAPRTANRTRRCADVGQVLPPDTRPVLTLRAYARLRLRDPSTGTSPTFGACSARKQVPWAFVAPEVDRLRRLSVTAANSISSSSRVESHDRKAHLYSQANCEDRRPFHEVWVPYDACRSRQRPTPGLPHPAVLRLQVFSTSWRLDSACNLSDLISCR